MCNIDSIHKKIAVIFPGIGYHTDKPLLYYSKKLAASYGYEIREVKYGNFKEGIKGSARKMQEAYQSALMQTEELLCDIDFSQYQEILYISKSIGTVVAASFGDRYQLETKNIYFTPVEQSFAVISQPGIAFHGTKDPWVSDEIVTEGCRQKGLSLYLTEGANHSLETGDVKKDLQILITVMQQCETYLK